MNNSNRNTEVRKDDGEMQWRWAGPVTPHAVWGISLMGDIFKVSVPQSSATACEIFRWLQPMHAPKGRLAPKRGDWIVSPTTSLQEHICFSSPKPKIAFLGSNSLFSKYTVNALLRCPLHPNIPNRHFFKLHTTLSLAPFWVNKKDEGMFTVVSVFHQSPNSENFMKNKWILSWTYFTE